MDDKIQSLHLFPVIVVFRLT